MSDEKDEKIVEDNSDSAIKNIFLNIYLPVSSAFVSSINEKKYPNIKSIPVITLGVNQGIISLLFKTIAEKKTYSNQAPKVV